MSREQVNREQVSHRGNRSREAPGAEPLPGSGRRLPDAAFAAVVWAGLTVITATTVAMIGTDPHGPVEGTAAAATWLALVAQIVFLVRYGRLRYGSPQRAGLAEAPMRVDPRPTSTGPPSRGPRGATRVRASRVRVGRIRVGRIRTRRGRYGERPRYQERPQPQPRLRPQPRPKGGA